MNTTALLARIRYAHKVPGDPFGRLIDDWLQARCVWRPVHTFYGGIEYMPGCCDRILYSDDGQIEFTYCPHCGKLMEVTR